MRTKTQRTIKIEIVEHPIPIEEALGQIAKVIAREMYREEAQSKQEVKA